jgi:uncharacterized protein YprB with RNaseH-like and TPR domain
MNPGTGDDLRARLGELVRRRRAGQLAPAGVHAVRSPRTATGHAAAGEAPSVDAPGDAAAAAIPVRSQEATSREVATAIAAFLPGGEWRDAQGRPVYVHERLRSEVEKRRPHWGRLPMPPPGEPELSAIATLGLARVLFLDLETCGLASSPVFLAGTMHWNGEDFVLRQYFARHYGEEPALLAAVHEQARGFELLVTFNGKSYDAPFLHARALTHGVPLALPPYHLDLLHAARRRWKGVLRDCKLQTLEHHVCRRPRRVGDVPGEQVPGIYHEYVRRGDPYALVPVFHHNLLDVITMAEILHALCRPEPAAGARRR